MDVLCVQLVQRLSELVDDVALLIRFHHFGIVVDTEWFNSHLHWSMERRTGKNVCVQPVRDRVPWSVQPLRRLVEHVHRCLFSGPCRLDKPVRVRETVPRHGPFQERFERSSEVSTTKHLLDQASIQQFLDMSDSRAGSHRNSGRCCYAEPWCTGINRRECW